MYEEVKTIFFSLDRLKSAFLFLLAWFNLGQSPLFSGEVVSQGGKIDFNINGNEAKMVLNQTGLGLGVTPSSNLQVSGNALVSEALSIGNDAVMSSNLSLSGTFGFSSLTLSSNAVLDSHSVFFVGSAAQNIMLQLPYAANVAGRRCTVKKIEKQNSIWISGGGNLIDDTSPIELSHGELGSVEMLSNGHEWCVSRHYGPLATVAEANLVGWWKMDEKTGVTAVDSSGHDNHADVHMGSASQLGVKGVLGAAFEFEASAQTDHLIVPVDVSSSVLALQTFTWSIWAKFETLGVTRHFMNLNTKFSSNGNVFFRQEPDDRLRFFIYDGDNWDPRVQSSVAISANTWHHVVGTYDQSKLSIYIDGQGNTVARTEPVVYNTLGNLYIGNFSWQGNVNGHDGILDDVRIYNRVLTSDEIMALYQEGR